MNLMLLPRMADSRNLPETWWCVEVNFGVMSPQWLVCATSTRRIHLSGSNLCREIFSVGYLGATIRLPPTSRTGKNHPCQKFLFVAGLKARTFGSSWSS